MFTTPVILRATPRVLFATPRGEAFTPEILPAKFQDPIVASAILGGAGTCSFFTLVFAAKEMLWLRAMIAGVFLLASLWLYRVTWQIQFHKYSTIIPKHRNEVPGFWARNSDKIILVIISAAIGCLTTLLVKKLTGP